MKDWWLAQSPRDRRILAIGSMFVVVAIFYSFLWEPLYQRHAKYQLQIQEQHQLLQWMQERSAEAKQLMTRSPAHSPTQRSKPKRKGSLLSLVDRLAKKAGLGDGLKRVEPVGRSGVRLWLEDVEFTHLSDWLNTLSSQHGAEVDSAAIDRAEAPGRVNARLLIQWGDA